MTARTYGVDLNGCDANLIGVQCEIMPGKTAFRINGLAVTVASRTTNRIRIALFSMGLSLPAKTITVTITAEGQSTDIAHLDLPIAMSLLTAMGIIPSGEAERQVCIGGLSECGMDIVLLPRTFVTIFKTRGADNPGAKGVQKEATTIVEPTIL